MKGYKHRVDTRRRRQSVPPLPKDAWRGRTFREANGTELESIWNGRDPGPGERDWPEGLAMRGQTQARGKLHLSPNGVR